MRRVLLSPHDLERADRFFARFGGAAVLIARVLPVLRTFIALPAGIAQMPLWRFHIYTFIGSWPWCFLLAWIGMLLGDRSGSDPRMKMAFPLCRLRHRAAGGAGCALVRLATLAKQSRLDPIVRGPVATDKRSLRAPGTLPMGTSWPLPANRDAPFEPSAAGSEAALPGRASRHFRAEVVGKTRKAGWWRPNRSHVISYLGLVRCDRMC